MAPARLVLLCILLALPARQAGADTEWFPSRGLVPRRLADPHEPMMRLTVTPVENRQEALLGAPLPLVRSRAGGWRWGVTVEAAAMLLLGRDGGFFPLLAADGLLGAGIEAEREGRLLRLRLIHVSAHLADGDTTVSYRGRTYSREFFDLEGGIESGALFIYAGGGAAWHAVPSDPGPHFFSGAVWGPSGDGAGPILAAHISIDRRRNWRLGKSLFAGVAFGDGPNFRMGIRFHDGFRPEGQYDGRAIRYVGGEIQYSP